MKKLVIILSIILVICSGVAGYVIYTRNHRCSEEQLQTLREQYPVVSSTSPALMSVAPNIPLYNEVKNTENYLELSFIGAADNVTMEEGTDKFGDSMGTYTLTGYKVKVENVIIGDSSLKGKEIIVRMNSGFDTANVNKEVSMFAGVSKRDGGDYWFSYAGAYYNADGYVLSVLEECPDDDYSGMTVYQFKNAIKDLKKQADEAE